MKYPSQLQRSLCFCNERMLGCLNALNVMGNHVSHFSKLFLLEFTAKLRFNQ